MLAMLFLLAGTDDPLVTTAATRLSACADVAACHVERAPSRFRIDDDDPAGVDAKARAVGDTGGKCSVVGARVCTGKPRRLYATAFTD